MVDIWFGIGNLVRSSVDGDGNSLDVAWVIWLGQPWSLHGKRNGALLTSQVVGIRAESVENELLGSTVSSSELSSVGGIISAFLLLELESGTTGVWDHCLLVSPWSVLLGMENNLRVWASREKSIFTFLKSIKVKADLVLSNWCSINQNKLLVDGLWNELLRQHFIIKY